MAVSQTAMRDYGDIRHATWFVGAVESFRFFDLEVYALADQEPPTVDVISVDAEGEHALQLLPANDGSVSNTISAISQSAPVAPASAATQKSSAKPAAQASPAQDSVSLSSAALAAMKEATETSSQTAKEASQGDHQAQRLLARETAAKQRA